MHAGVGAAAEPRPNDAGRRLERPTSRRTTWPSRSGRWRACVFVLPLIVLYEMYATGGSADRSRDAHARAADHRLRPDATSSSACSAPPAATCRRLRGRRHAAGWHICRATTPGRSGRGRSPAWSSKSTAWRCPLLVFGCAAVALPAARGPHGSRLERVDDRALRWGGRLRRVRLPADRVHAAQPDPAATCFGWSNAGRSAGGDRVRQFCFRSTITWVRTSFSMANLCVSDAGRAAILALLFTLRGFGITALLMPLTTLFVRFLTANSL